MVVPPSRLMTVIHQSLKWQQYIGKLPKGSQYDLLAGTAPVVVEDEEKYPTKNDKVIKVQ